MTSILSRRSRLIGLMVSTLLSAQLQAAQTVELDIPSQPLSEALRQLGTVSNTNIIFEPGMVNGLTAPAIKGKVTAQEALARLLMGTRWSFKFVDENTVSLVPADTKAAGSPASDRSVGLRLPSAVLAEGGRYVQASAAAMSPSGNIKGAASENRDGGSRIAVDELDAKGIPEVLVTGTRSLNMDIRRTEDDPQPYVVFDREQLERSGAVSLDQFFQQRLTMSSGIVNHRNTGGGATQISLRGLGAGQTLVLVDGRRLTGPSLYGTPGQADVASIPMAAIERVEVLPTTASGIYGGSATGGVVNIILRRDYTGAEVNVTYENTFASDTPSGKVDFSFGHNFNDGRTNLIFGGSYADAANLYTRDRYRQLIRRTREGTMSTYPEYFLTPTGQPPLSNRPNIASRDGSTLVLDDGTPLGSSFTSVPQGYGGVASDGGAALVERAGTYNWELSDTSSVHSRGSGGRQGLNGPVETKSGMLSLRHEFSETLHGFLDFSMSDRTRKFWSTDNGVVSFLLPADAANNPFTQDIRVVAPVSEDGGSLSRIKSERGALGVVKRLNGQWQMGADVSWSHASIAARGAPRYNASLFNADLSNGSIDILRDTSEFPIDLTPYAGTPNGRTPFESTMKDFNVRAAGPVWAMPAGSAMMSGALGYRTEDLDDAYEVNYTRGSTYYPDRSQKVKSVYVELLLPLFSAENARKGLRELDLQISVRRDEYTSYSGESVSVDYSPGQDAPSGIVRSSQSFNSIDPTIALRWAPIQDLTARFSYGTGFLPPGLDQIIGSSSPLQVGPWWTDPLRGGTPAGDNPEGPATRLDGGNPALKPEKSESWSAGLIFTPRLLPGVRVSVDYTRLKKTDAISHHPGAIQGLINDEALFPGRIVRGPNLPGDPAGWAGPIILLDATQMNLAESRLEAWDTRLDIRKDTQRHGTFELMLMSTWQPHFTTKTLAGYPEVESVGQGFSNPSKFRATAGLLWSRAAWRVGWNTNYYHSYYLSPFSSGEEIAFQGNGGVVPKQIYHDVFANYNFGSAGSAASELLENTEIQIGIRNVFNKAPPIDANARWIGMFSPFGDPRMATYTLSIKKAF